MSLFKKGRDLAGIGHFCFGESRTDSTRQRLTSCMRDARASGSLRRAMYIDCQIVIMRMNVDLKWSLRSWEAECWHCAHAHVLHAVYVCCIDWRWHHAHRESAACIHVDTYSKMSCNAAFWRDIPGKSRKKALCRYLKLFIGYKTCAYTNQTDRRGSLSSFLKKRLLFVLLQIASYIASHFFPVSLLFLLASLLTFLWGVTTHVSQVILSVCVHTFLSFTEFSCVNVCK